MKVSATFLVVSIWALGASFFAQQTVVAQTTSSPYSRFGLGELMAPGYGRSQAMGGVGIGLRLPNMLNTANPASYSVVGNQSFLFDVGLQYQQTYYETVEQTQLANGANLTHLAIAFPLVSRRWFTSVGLSPYSTVGYEVQTYNYKPGVGDNTVVYRGAGGVNRVYWGHALRLFGGLSVGANMSYLFGTIDNLRSSELTDDKYISQLSWEDHTVVRDFSFDYGIQYQHSFGPKLSVTLGASYQQASKIDAEKNRLITNLRYVDGRRVSDPNTGASTIDTLQVISKKAANLDIPEQLGLGLSVVLFERLVLAADYQTGRWAELSSDDLGTYNDTRRMNFGMEYIPNYRSLKYWQRVYYRAGFQTSNTYWNIAGQQVQDRSVSAGIGLPMKRSNSVVDIALELGQRGNNDQLQLSETYFKATVNFTLQDFWFIKRKYD